MKRLIATAKYRRKPAGTELTGISIGSRRALLALGMAVEEDAKPLTAPAYARRDMRAAEPKARAKTPPAACAMPPHMATPAAKPDE